jgi:hypothetical protein
VGIGYGTCQWVLTKELGMHCVAAKFVPRILTADQKQQLINILTQQFLAIDKMAVIPHPPYSPNLAPCDFFQFPKMKLKLKGRQFDSIEDIQAELQSAWHSDKKGLPGSVKKMEMVGLVYLWEGTTSRVMAADRPYGEFYDSYSVSPEYFGYHHVELEDGGRKLLGNNSNFLPEDVMLCPKTLNLL